MKNNPLKQDLVQIKDVITKPQGKFEAFRDEANMHCDQSKNLPAYNDVSETNKNLEEFEILLGNISEIANIQINPETLPCHLKSIPCRELSWAFIRDGHKP